MTIADLAKFVADMLIMDPTEDPKTGRQLLVLVFLLGYMTISACVYTILEPMWSFLDSFYFCLVSLVRYKNSNIQCFNPKSFPVNSRIW